MVYMAPTVQTTTLGEARFTPQPDNRSGSRNYNNKNRRSCPSKSNTNLTTFMCCAISGTLKQSEFAAEQADIARRIDSGSKPRVLVIGEKFEGWERGADWNDLDFMISHGGEIAKIAIVAEPRWEVQALAFAGAGVRRAPVRFFPPDELSAARAWLTG